MTTNYAPAAPANLAAPVAPAATRYRGAAELCAAIRAAACLAPEMAPQFEFPERYARRGADVHRYPFTVPAMLETGACIVMAPARGFGNVSEVETDGAASRWPQLREHPEAPGPFMPAPIDARVSFAYECGGARGSLTVANVRADLLRLADKVHAARGAFDGKTRRAPGPKRPASSAPHVAARAMYEAGDYAGALAIAEARGAAFFGCSNESLPHPYMAAEPAEAAGIPCTIARSVRTGRFRVLHTASGLSVDSVRAGAPDDRGFATGAAARDWLETRAASADFPALLRAADKRAAPFDQAAARAAYLAATWPEFRGADEAAPVAIEAAPAASDPAEAAPVAADPAPAAPGAARYVFAAHLIGTDSQRIETLQHECTGPGLTSADIQAAHRALRELAAARGMRVVSENFADSAARAWAEPIAQAAAMAPPAAHGAPVATGAAIGAPGAATGPARPIQGKTSRAAIDAARIVGAITAAAAAAPNDPEPSNPGPAAPGGRVTVREVSAQEFDATARAAAARAEFSELAAPAEALTLAANRYKRLTMLYAPDSGRAALIEAARAGMPGAAGRLAEALQRLADLERGTARTEAARALAELRAAAGAPAENPHAPAPERIEAGAPPATQSAPVPPATQSQTAPERAHSLAAAAMARAAANPAGYVWQLAAECAAINLEIRAGIDEAANGAALRALRAELRRAQAAAATGAPPAAEPAARAPVDGDTFRVHETLPGGAVWTGAEVCTARRASDVWQTLVGALGNINPGCVRWATCARTGAYLLGFHRNGTKLDAPPAFVPVVAPPATHSEAAPHSLDRLRRIHDRIQATRATTVTRYGQRWVRIMNRLRTLMHSHPEWAAYKRGGTPPATQSGPPAATHGAPKLGGGLYRAQCRAYSLARRLLGLPGFAPGQGCATRADSSDPLVTFHAFPAYRTPGAKALRARVAAALRAERAQRSAPDPAEVARLATLRADRPETLREAADGMRRAADHCAALPAGYGIPDGEAQALQRAAEFDAAAELAEARRAGPFRVMIDAEKTAGEAPTIEAARELAARLAAAEPFPCTFTIHGPGGELIEDAATAAGLPMLQPGAVRADAAAAEWAAAQREAGTLAARAAELASAPTAPECGGSVEFVHRTDATRRAIAGPEMSAGRGHLWRCSFFDAAGAVSDCGVGSLAAACGIALSAGFEPVPPAAELVRAALREQAARIEAPRAGRDARSNETRRELAAELREQAAAIAPATHSELIESQAAPVDPIAWQVRAARPHAVYASPVYRVGVHEWCAVVYAHPLYAACTDYLWRRVDQNRGRFRTSNEWPAYNSNDSHNGLPHSLLPRVWMPNREAIEHALDETRGGRFAPWVSDATRAEALAGIEAAARTAAHLASARAPMPEAAPAADAGPWRFSACAAPEYAPPNRPVHVLFTPNRARAMGQGGEPAGDCVGFYMARETYRALPGLALATPADFERFGALQPAPAGFLWSAAERAAEAQRNGCAPLSHAEPEAKPEAAPDLAPASPAAEPGKVSLILHNVLVSLQHAAADGVPTVHGLESEAARIEAAGRLMERETRGGYGHACALQTMANYCAVAADLRELAATRRADEAAERDAAAHYSDPWPVMVARAHHAAHRAPSDPLLRIPAGDPRLRIPATFAPGYLLRA